MKPSDLKGKRVTVFGLGLNEGGVGTVEFLERSGVREVIVTDVKKREGLLSSLKHLEKYRNITYVLGAHRPEDFLRTDLVVKNPAIPWTNEYVRLAEKSAVPVEMDSGLFFMFCRNPVIGVTGTRGKTTTASMIAHIFEHAKRPVARVGISQVPVLGMLEKIRPEDTVVFELSSWRLSALGRLKRSPEVAVFTNLYPDHLNYYKTVSAYRKDKEYIYRFQKKDDIAVFNADNETTMMLSKESVGRTFLFSIQGDIPGDGSFFRDDHAIVRIDGKETVMFTSGDIAVPGDHNRANALAAGLVAFLRGIHPDAIAEAVRSFGGVPHRLELVAEKRGVSYYNDTAATSPDGAVAALRSFPGKPIILLAGGADKNLSFGSFAEEILARTKGVVFFKGEATESIKRELRKIMTDAPDAKFETVDSMAKAVEMASRSAEPGDVVLLSPGAASFGLFSNEFDRGERFRAAVAALPEK
ncbi:MAG: UDP-N-acetylmuramoyl-L-alanine--D-glutamate ligase [Candidatus Moranbacteria bacterium]|nr:UDP-N-acetylmuramoyl-L-alanine--D-glutamate ligase [Candidatus Moranbacteria bacterium]